MYINISDSKDEGSNKFLLSIKASYGPNIVGENTGGSILKFKYPPVLRYKIDLAFDLNEEYFLYLSSHPSIENKNLNFIGPQIFNFSKNKDLYISFRYECGINDIVLDKNVKYMKVDSERIYKKGELIARCFFLKKNYFFVEK